MHKSVILITGYKSKEHIYSIQISRTEERMLYNILDTNQPFHTSFFPSIDMNITLIPIMCSMLLWYIQRYTWVYNCSTDSERYFVISVNFLLIHQENASVNINPFYHWHMIKLVKQQAITSRNLGWTGDTTIIIIKKALMHVRLYFILVLIFLGLKGVFWRLGLDFLIFVVSTYLILFS